MIGNTITVGITATTGENEMKIVTYKNCRIRFPGIYTPWVAPVEYPNLVQYGVVLYQDENQHLQNDLSWKSTRDPFTQEYRMKTAFKSKLPPIVTVENSDYSTLLVYRYICDARNIPYNVIFRGAIVDIVTGEDGYLLEIIPHILENPSTWQPDNRR